uniref:Uncharacterized protein n=1 Tax=Meloidogyne incognita TaxID=6306 RepID=A0A914KZT2_MELIC
MDILMWAPFGNLARATGRKKRREKAENKNKNEGSLKKNRNGRKKLFSPQQLKTRNENYSSSKFKDLHLFHFI